MNAKLQALFRDSRFSGVVLIALLLLFFVGIVALVYKIPFDARLFPVVVGSAGILLTLGIAIEQMRRRGARDASMVDEDDPAAKADWPRYATALLAAPAFGLMFWLFGFIVASPAAMLRSRSGSTCTSSFC